MNKFYTEIQLKFLGDEAPGKRREVDIISREDDFIYCRVDGFDTALRIDEIFNEDSVFVSELLRVIQ